MGRRLAFDLEANGLLDTISTIHCIAAKDIDTGEAFNWKPWEVEEGVRFLETADLLIGHNIIGYDCLAIEKLYPGWKRPPCRDTLIMAKVVWPRDILIGRDIKLINAKRLPPKYMKSHALGAWGYRLGNLKGEYSGGWDVWSQDMHDYMIQDVEVTVDLWRLLMKRLGWVEPEPGAYVWPELPFEIEHDLAVIIREQEATGFCFDRPAAIALAADLANRKAALEEQLIDLFGSWWAPLDDPEKGTRPAKAMTRKLTQFPDITVPRFGKNGKALKPYIGPPMEHLDPEAPFVRIRRTTFSPSSRDHLGQRLQAVYGWKPTARGDNGKPTVDEGTIKAIPEEVLPADVKRLLLDYFVVTKTLGQLSAGKKSWLSCCGDDQRIHGRMGTCDAVTGRGIHMDPNLGQVPAVSKNKQKEVLLGIEGGFGWECRSLFTASPGKEMTGSDCTALELLCLGHYLAPHDGGAFVDRVGDPDRDAHTEHSEITGETREDTKTVTYAYVYGAGAAKVGESLSLTDEELPGLLAYPALKNVLSWMKRKAGDDWVEPNDKAKARIAKGHRVIKAFENGIPGMKDLKDGVAATARERGWVKGLDGRKLYVRKDYASLNTLLQGAGAIICKLWIVLMHRRFKELGLTTKIKQVAWVHDEIQCDHEPGRGPLIAKVSNECVKQAGEMLGFRGILRTDAKTGRNWAETH